MKTNLGFRTLNLYKFSHLILSQKYIFLLHFGNVLITLLKETTMLQPYLICVCVCPWVLLCKPDVSLLLFGLFAFECNVLSKTTLHISFQKFKTYKSTNKL